MKHQRRIIDSFCYVTDYVANGSFASLKQGVTYRNKPDYAILVRVTDFTKKWNGNYVWVDKDSYDFLNKSSLKEGDLIIANVGETGKCFIVPDLGQPMTLGPNSILVRPQPETCNTKYLYYYFSSEVGQAEIEKISSATTQSKFNKTSFRKLEIPLPPLHIQEQIAETLDKADALRRKDQELLQKYDELAQAIFYDMFGDPVRNEKGWLLSNLEELVYNCNNKRIPVKESDRSQLKKIYPYYGASGIIDYVENYLFEGQHLLVGEDGANLLSRSTPIAFLASEKFWVNNHAHVMREKNVPLEFIETVINCTDLTPYVSGSAQPKLTREKLDSIPIINPPGKLVQGYVEKLNNLRNAMGLIKKQNIMSEQLFLGTSRKYFS